MVICQDVRLSVQCMWAAVFQSWTGTLKMREWKTWVCEKYRRGKSRTGNVGPNFTGVDKAGPPSMQREMYNVQIRKHFSRAKKLLINITECSLE